MDERQDASREADGTLTSEFMARLIVDELIPGGLISKDRFADAVEITSEELDARKAMGDY